MKLKQILDNFDYIVENGSVDTEICHLVMGSRKVEPGDVFVCISGAVTDGHDYVEEVIEKVLWQLSWKEKYHSVERLRL